MTDCCRLSWMAGNLVFGTVETNFRAIILKVASTSPLLNTSDRLALILKLKLITRITR